MNTKTLDEKNKIRESLGLCPIPFESLYSGGIKDYDMANLVKCLLYVGKRYGKIELEQVANLITKCLNFEITKQEFNDEVRKIKSIFELDCHKYLNGAYLAAYVMLDRGYILGFARACNYLDC